MDRSWITAPRISEAYQHGVEEFLSFAEIHSATTDGNFFCPCVKCVNGRRHSLDDIRSHLICDGFSPTYTKWIWHGENLLNVLDDQGCCNWRIVLHVLCLLARV